MLVDSRQIANTAYEAAMDGKGWEAWMHSMSSALGGTAWTLFVIGSGSMPIERTHYHWHNDKVMEEYLAGLYLKDPLLRQILDTKKARLLLSQEQRLADDPAARAYLDWLRAVADVDHSAVFTVPVSDGRWAGFSTHFSTSRGPLVNGELAGLRAILPDIKRALRLGYEHDAMLGEAFWQGMAGPRGDEPALLLGEQGRVLRATGAAERLFSQADGLLMTNNRLHCAAAEDAAALEAAIGQGIASQNAKSGAVQVHRASGKRPFIVIVYPLPRTRRMLAPFEAAALVRIVERTAPAANLPEWFVNVFGLTAREADLLALMMAGHSVESAAAVLDIALATGRIHLRRLLAKTGTSRQAELTALLARIT